MDKYEFNIKVEQIKKLINKSDFETAMKIADTIDWRRVRNANLLSMIAQVYEKNEEYQEAKEILLLAFERAPIGKRLLFKLAELALKEGNTEEAQDYYREFCDLAPEDPRQHLLRYQILKAKKAPAEQLLHSLEQYTSIELDERWLYELAELYRQAGREEDCVRTCDKIMLMFGLGKYVDKAMELKIQYQPLTGYQMDLVENRDKYEAKLRAVEQEYGGETDDMETEEYDDDEPVPQTMDEELAASIHQAEAEERLAEELSRISVEEYGIQEDTSGYTKILSDIRGIAGESFETSELALEPVSVEEDPEEETTQIETLFEDEPDEDPEEEEPVVEEIEEIEDIEEIEEELAPVANHLMIEARTPEKGLEMAIEALKKIHRETATKNPVAKITGSKLSKKGIFEVADKLAGKDVVIEEAGDLSKEALEDLQTLMEEDTSGMIVVLIDNPRQLEEMHSQNPEFASMFECIGAQDHTESDIEKAVLKRAEAEEKIAKEMNQAGGTSKPAPQVVSVTSEQAAPVEKPKHVPIDDDEEMDLDEFAEYASKYASEIDCSIAGKSMLALYERIELMEEDGIALTKANAEELIEEAADRAEKPTLGRLITGVFSSKYDKEGLLILKEEHFID